MTDGAQSPLLNVVRAAAEYRQQVQGGPNWQALHAWNQLCKALDALTESGALVELDKLTPVAQPALSHDGSAA